MVMMDRFTRWAEPLALRKAEVSVLSQRYGFLVMEVPTILVSD